MNRSGTRIPVTVYSLRYGMIREPASTLNVRIKTGADSHLSSTLRSSLILRTTHTAQEMIEIYGGARGGEIRRICRCAKLSGVLFACAGLGADPG